MSLPTLVFEHPHHRAAGTQLAAAGQILMIAFAERSVSAIDTHTSPSQLPRVALPVLVQQGAEQRHGARALVREGFNDQCAAAREGGFVHDAL